MGKCTAQHGLTRRQADLLAYVRSCAVTPSYRQICAAIGLNSTSGVARIVEALAERGFIARVPHRARSLRLIEPEAAMLARFSIAALEREILRRRHGKMRG